MSELCTLTVEESDRIALATLAGEVDASNADQLGADLRVRLSNRLVGVIVNLSDVTYIDSYGVAVLFDLNRRLETRQQRLHVVVPDGARLRRVLELLDFSRLAAVDASVAEARANLASPGGDAESTP